MKNKSNTYLFEQMPLSRAIMTLAIPTVVSSLVVVLYNLADTWFVGLLNDPVQNSAVTLASPVTLAFFFVTNLFGVGSSSMMGRALGAKDIDTAKRSAAIGFWATVLSGLAFSLLYFSLHSPILTGLGASGENRQATADYLLWTVTLGAAPSMLNVVLGYLVRTEGASMHASIGTMSGCILNIFLDPIFVLPKFLNMGAAGAGCATFISNCAACLYFFVLLFFKRKTTFVCLNPKMAVPKAKIIRGIFTVGIPAGIQNLLNVTGMTILNNFTSAFGTDAVAAMGIAYKTYMIPIQVSFGLTQGIMPLVSYNYGSRDYQRARKSVILAGKIAVIFLVAVGTGFFVFSDSIIYAFIKSDAVIAFGGKFLKAMCLALPFQCIDFLGVSTYQACGKGALSLIYAVMRKGVLEIPALIILNRLFPLYGLPYAQPFAEFVLAIGAFFTIKLMFSKMEQQKKL